MSAPAPVCWRSRRAPSARRSVVALDVDPDALASARENLALNQAAGGVALLELDLAAAPAALGRRFDVVLANLTGAMLSRYAAELARLAAPGGPPHRERVSGGRAGRGRGSLEDAGWTVLDREVEDGWVGD